MFAAGLLHLRQAAGLTVDRLVNPLFLAFVLPGFLSPNVIITQATLGQLFIFLCGFLGLMGAALSLATLAPGARRATPTATETPKQAVPHKST